MKMITRILHLSQMMKLVLTLFALTTIRGTSKRKHCKNIIMKGCRRIGKSIDKSMIEFFFMHFRPGTITTHAESINSDLQRGLDRRLRHIQH